MFFFRGPSAKNAFKELHRIRKEVLRIPLKERGRALEKKILAIVNDLQLAQEDIQLRLEEIRDIRISERLFPQLNRLYSDELIALNTLHHDLDFYLDYVRDGHSEKEIEEILGRLDIECKRLEVRDKKFEEIVSNFRAETLRQRVQTLPQIPAQNTNDGISWRNVCSACVQMGANVELVKNHQVKINFPRVRPIPLSADVSSTALAHQIRRILQNIYLKSTIPKVRIIRAALAQGSL